MQTTKKKAPIVNKEQYTDVSIDDFAKRKGRTYATSMTNPITNEIIDLFDSRQTDDVTEWLKGFPNLKAIVRDGSLSYRKAAEDAHPGIMQVSDRFHLVAGVLDHALDYIKKLPKFVLIPEENAESVPDASLPEPTETDINGEPLSESEQRRRMLANEARRLHEEEHLNYSEIARRMGMSRETIRKYCAADYDPRFKAIRCRIGILDSYDTVIQQMVSENASATEIYRHLRSLGFKGSYPSVYRYVRRYKEADRKPFPAGERIPRSVLAERVFRPVSEISKLTSEQFEDVCRVFPELASVYECADSFRAALFSGDPDLLSAWVAETHNHPVPDMQSAASGVERDIDAARNAVVSPLSNAAAEGNHTKIKLEKRIMYGRCSFELLRSRVLLKQQRRQRRACIVA